MSATTNQKIDENATESRGQNKESAPTPERQTTFTLWAPYNKEAALLGSFNDWQAQPMNKGEDGYFHLELELPDGEYYYRFAVRSLSWFNEPDAWVEVVDPFATELSPDESAAKITIQDGRVVLAPFEWSDADAELSPPESMVIYELHVGQFGAADAQLGGFKQLTQKLDYLNELGVSALQLMPVQEFPGRESMGYNPCYYLAPEQAYGSPVDFKAFVNQAHLQGLRVLGDMVFNHADPECPLTQIDHDYWFLPKPKDPEHHWGPEFNYDKYDENFDVRPAWAFVERVVSHWLQAYHLDGIRYDATRQISHCEFLSWITALSHERSGDKYFFNIAEHIPDEPEFCRESGVDMLWHDSFCHTVRELLSQGRVEPSRFYDALDAQRRGYDAPLRVINYLSNHDQPRLLRYLQEHMDEAEALKRYRLGCLILFTAVGIPMLRMGDEFGANAADSEPGQPLAWEKLESEQGRALFDLHKSLIHWRRSLPSLQYGSLEWLSENDNQVVFVRQAPEEAAVLVALNPSDAPLQYTLQDTGQWRGLYQAEDAAGHLQVELEPWSAALWLQEF